MGTLVEDLGSRYVNEFFGNAYFLHNDVLYKFIQIRNDKVEAYTMDYDGMNPSYNARKIETLDASVLHSFRAFSWPKLGYRNVNTFDGKCVAGFLQTHRSTRRGLSADLISVSYSNATDIYNLASKTSLYTECFIPQVYKPTWFTYKQALQMLQEQKAISVAINEDLAISLSIDADAPEDALYEIAFRERIVGYVKRNGSVEFKNKKFSHLNLFKRLT